jgi:hypothetical protein
MDRIVFDTEADGLLDTVSNIWCLSYKNIDTSAKHTFIKEELTKRVIYQLFDKVQIIGHNIIAYDIPLIEKFYGVNLIERLGHENIIDTYIWSQTLYPDRPMPRGCPDFIRNEKTNKTKKIGPHGLESWGWRVGNRKLQIDDWEVFTPEIPKRCEGDVEINEKVYYALCEEAGINQ